VAEFGTFGPHPGYQRDLDVIEENYVRILAVDIRWGYQQNTAKMTGRLSPTRRYPRNTVGNVNSRVQAFLSAPYSSSFSPFPRDHKPIFWDVFYAV
jgi:hypothetical protein